MNDATRERLLEAGVDPTSVDGELTGQDKVLAVAGGELVYIDDNGTQRASLREVTKVSTERTGALSVRAAHGPLIEGTVRGFDPTELKFFFETVKRAVARAKAGGSATQPAAPARLVVAPTDPWDDHAEPGPSPQVAPTTRPEPAPSLTAPRLENFEELEPERPLAATPVPPARPEPVLATSVWTEEAQSVRPESPAPEPPARSAVAMPLKLAAGLAGLLGVVAGVLELRAGTSTLTYVRAAAWVAFGVAVGLLAYGVGEMLARRLPRRP